MTISRTLLVFWLCWVALSENAYSDVQLPTLIGENMVLQREQPIRIWGWADPDEKVTVQWHDGKPVTTAADRNRRWEVQLPPMKAGGPYELRVSGKNQLVRKNILVGEVWFCSGQSNMEMGVVKARNHDQEIAAADYPQIRLFTAPKRESKSPTDDVQASWLICSPKTVSYFSASAYFFGRELHQHLKVPIGLMVAAVGGTRIEPWTPAVGVKAVKELEGKDAPRDGDLYNGMVHPFTSYRIRGVIWYQGEGNVGDGMLYTHRMRALVHGWREQWNLGEFPFYYVQIAPLNWGGKPVDLHPQLWEAQTAAMSIPHSGMVVTTDIGNPGDAHPRNKQDVGKRLAAWALAKTYGDKDRPYCGPIYQKMTVEKAKIRIHFQYAEGGLSTRDGKPLSWFTIAGADQKFVPAKADIDGETVLVWADAVPEPKAVRFGWHQIAEPNLMNRHKLPASPFRTDRDGK